MLLEFIMMDKWIKKKKSYLFNLATNFVSILDDISKQENSEINCIYFEKEKEKFEKRIKRISLIYDFRGENIFKNDKIFLELQKLNSFFENNIELYINGQKTKFEFYYNMKGLKEINVKFRFNKKMPENISFMFYNCSCLKSIDLSKFYTSKVKNMNHMFDGCYSLESIDFSSFNTSNVNDMSHMFDGCSSLESINLSSFNIKNVNNMSFIFSFCKILKSIFVFI